MADFLSDDAIFTCDKGGVVIKCEDSGNDSVKYNGANLLTIGATVKFKAGACVPLQSPCNCQLTAWVKGFSLMKTSSGKPLLLDTAENFCSVGGGRITVQSSGVNSHITTGNAPASMSIVEVAKNNSATAENISTENKQSAAQNPTAKNSTGNIENISVTTAATAAAVTPKKLLSKTSKNLFCPYNENNEACQNCEYPRTPATVDNNSKILRTNYLKHIADASNRDSVDEYFLTVQDKFKFQAHHLISGNQIFAPIKKTKDGRKINKRAKLVRLANFCGYDINNALNCIMLVANEDDYGQKAGGKSASAYDAMSLSKIQWHVGGHSYKFPKEEKNIKNQIRFYTKTNFDEPIKNYIELVSAELDKIEASLTSCNICRNSPQAKRGLITRLNNLSQKIKKKLGAFTEKPQKSFPYYVSKEAYFYAFNLPRTAKIILVSRADSEFLFEKFRAERFDEVLTSDSGKKLIFNPKDPQKFSLDTRESKLACTC